MRFALSQAAGGGHARCRDGNGVDEHADKNVERGTVEKAELLRLHVVELPDAVLLPRRRGLGQVDHQPN